MSETDDSNDKQFLGWATPPRLSELSPPRRRTRGRRRAGVGASSSPQHSRSRSRSPSPLPSRRRRHHHRRSPSPPPPPRSNSHVATAASSSSASSSAAASSSSAAASRSAAAPFSLASVDPHAIVLERMRATHRAEVAELNAELDEQRAELDALRKQLAAARQAHADDRAAQHYAALRRAAVEVAYVLELVPAARYRDVLQAGAARSERVSFERFYRSPQPPTDAQQEHAVAAFLNVFDADTAADTQQQPQGQASTPSITRARFYQTLGERGDELEVLFSTQRRFAGRRIQQADTIAPVDNIAADDDDHDNDEANTRAEASLAYDDFAFGPLVHHVGRELRDEPAERRERVVEAIRTCMRSVGEAELHSIDELSEQLQRRRAFDHGSREPGSGKALEHWNIAPLAYNVHVRHLRCERPKGSELDID